MTKVKVHGVGSGIAASYTAELGGTKSGQCWLLEGMDVEPVL